MATWKSLDARLKRDEKSLHDYLWRPGWTGDSEALFEDLVRDAKDLDDYLKAGGKLARRAKSLASAARAKGKPGSGESLFELLSHAYDLTAATEHYRSGDFGGAGDHLKEVMGSVTIGVCANAGCFQYVQEWESKKIAFEAYMGKLADHLESKGVATAGEWKRLVSAAYRLKETLDPATPKPEQALAARAAIATAGYATLASISIRKSLGAAPKYPYGDFAAVLSKIVARV